MFRIFGTAMIRSEDSDEVCLLNYLLLHWACLCYLWRLCYHIIIMHYTYTRYTYVNIV